MKRKEESREEFVIKIGKLLKDVLEKQKEKIKEVTYGCVNSSDYEAGEIIAKKIIEKRLL